MFQTIDPSDRVFPLRYRDDNLTFNEVVVNLRDGTEIVVYGLPITTDGFAIVPRVIGEQIEPAVKSFQNRFFGVQRVVNSPINIALESVILQASLETLSIIKGKASPKIESFPLNYRSWPGDIQDKLEVVEAVVPKVAGEGCSRFFYNEKYLGTIVGDVDREKGTYLVKFSNPPNAVGVPILKPGSKTLLGITLEIVDANPELYLVQRVGRIPDLFKN